MVTTSSWMTLFRKYLAQFLLQVRSEETVVDLHLVPALAGGAGYVGRAVGERGDVPPVPVARNHQDAHGHLTFSYHS